MISFNIEALNSFNIETLNTKTFVEIMGLYISIMGI